jgi:glucose/arabinose dehydrogenase
MARQVDPLYGLHPGRLVSRFAFPLIAALLTACGGSSSPQVENAALERIPHTECVAPATPHGEMGAIGLEAAFPNLPAMSWILGLHQAPGDDEFWYAGLRDGEVVRFANDPDTSTLETFLRLDNVRTNFEMGFLGIAFHPDYQENGQVFVSYNDSSALGRTTISRLSLNGGTVIDMSTEEPILTVHQPADNHNGGQIHFGPDGYLYIGLGDGGANATESQNTGTLLGALLRIDVDREEAPRAYGIPADNPFVDNPAFAPEIYAYGLRNPWRWNFDQVTGELWLGDVGQSTWEEVNVVEAGDNFGWPIMEGDQCFAGGANCDTTGLKLPRLQYSHVDGSCSITGGFVYRGSAIPALAGDYIFSDWCTGFVWRAFNETGSWEREQIADAWFNVPAFGQGHDGEIYVLNPFGGPGQAIFRIVPISEAGEGAANIPTHLSETGCYESTASKALAPFVVPYGIHAERWADGANMRRGFAIPDGSLITLESDGAFNLPVGSILIQELLDGDRTLETRLLMHHQSGWAGYSYEWLPDGTDAVLMEGGKSVDTGN